MSASPTNGENNSHYLPTWPPHAIEMAQMAYELTSQEWALTGQGELHPTVSHVAQRSRGEFNGNASGGDYNNIVQEFAQRMVALLFIRLVALLTCRLGNRYEDDKFDTGGGSRCRQQKKIYADYSTSTICRTVLTHSKQHIEQNRDFEMHNPSCDGGDKREHTPNLPAQTLPAPPFPAALTRNVLNQLYSYTLAICQGYHSAREVPYHNVEHAYHVFLSGNKLLDLMLCVERVGADEKKVKPPTFGIKSDPLVQLAFLFSALVHDVDHTGISNRQLVLESDDLAVLYNDQSVAEQRSLAVAFTTLKQPIYEELRGVIFNPVNMKAGAFSRERASAPFLMSGGEDFFRFRKLVIDLVLATDIASPERTQIVKSKWKEAFGESAEKTKNKIDDNSKNDDKNVNFKPEVLEKAQRKVSTANSKVLSSSFVSAASAISFDTEYSDSVSSVDMLDDDDYNQNAAFSTKGIVDDFVSLGSSKSIDSKEIEADKTSGSSAVRRRRVRTAPQHLSASTTSIPCNRRRAARYGGLSRSISTPSELRSSPGHDTRRLGVRRALDLAGSTIEAVSSKHVNSESEMSMEDLEDDVDEFKATVVLEQMLRAADVGALLQDYENVRKWSTRLYKELNNGFYAARGEDPKNGWFENQIKFFDFYVLPLAKNLGITGVFSDEVGHMFVRCVKCNRSQWIEEGESATNLMFQKDEKERVHVFEKHTDLLSLQERTRSAKTSNTTLPTANHLQPGHSDKQAAATPHSSMARTSLLKYDEG
ncbi:hypothetical protein ACHAW6_009539 [Cyclotella cf. meneghiniana]